jgi:hypothetical protein
LDTSFVLFGHSPQWVRFFESPGSGAERCRRGEPSRGGAHPGFVLLFSTPRWVRLVKADDLNFPAGSAPVGSFGKNPGPVAGQLAALVGFVFLYFSTPHWIRSIRHKPIQRLRDRIARFKN